MTQLYRLAVSNPMYMLRILDGDEDYNYWLDRLIDVIPAHQVNN